MRRSDVSQALLRLAGYGVTLYAWQRRFINDSSRFRILLKPRGAGATFTMALEALTNAILKPKSTTILISYSLRQSLEIFRHLKEILERAGSKPVSYGGATYRLTHSTGERSTVLGKQKQNSLAAQQPRTPQRIQGGLPLRGRGGAFQG